MTIIVLDSPGFAPIVGQLPVGEDVRVLTVPVGNIGPAERAIYIANLNAGGKKAQMDVLRENPQVQEWFVLSEGTEEDSWFSFRDKLPNCSIPVHTFSSVEELIHAISRPAVQGKSCLVLSRRETPDADPLIALLKLWMPDWTFEKAASENDPEICFHTTCSRILLLGRAPIDFFGIRVPENARPLIVIPRLEEKVLQSMHPNKFMDHVFRSVAGLTWSREMQERSFFFVSTAYEQFRLDVRKDPNLFSSLARDLRFDMWDRYGLPERRSAYTKEKMSEFLSQFDGCERIAARLLNQAM